MKKIILLNILILILLLIVFLVAGFALGYSGGRFGTDAGLLFLLVVAVHLFLNYIIVHRQKNLPPRTMLYSTLVLVCVYLLILFH